MSTTTPTKWPGTLEERELRRVQKVGLQFMTEWRAEPASVAHWMNVIRKETRLRDSWIWTKKRLTDTHAKLEALRAEVAGLIMVNRFKTGKSSSHSQRWFVAAAAQDDLAEGWYFDDGCLVDDGWIVTKGTIEATDSAQARNWTGWTKAQ